MAQIAPALDESLSSNSSSAQPSAPFLMDRLLAMQRVPNTASGTSFRGTFDPRLVNIWGGVQGGIIMAFTARALVDSMKSTPHTDMKHYYITFIGAPKGGAAFRINIRTTKTTRSFTFLEGEMEEDGITGAPYVRFSSIFTNFESSKDLQVRKLEETKFVPGQITSEYLDPHSETLLGRLGTTLPFEEAPKLWESIGPAGSYYGKSIFGELMDIRLPSREQAELYAAQLAKPAGSWFRKNIAVFAGAPDRRPVDPIYLAFLSETPSWSNALLPPAMLDAKGFTVSVLSFTLDFYCRVPAKTHLLVRNHHHGYTGDSGVPESTAWDPDTGRLVMLGRGMAFTRMPEKSKI